MKTIPFRIVVSDDVDPYEVEKAVKDAVVEIPGVDLLATGHVEDEEE